MGVRDPIKRGPGTVIVDRRCKIQPTINNGDFFPTDMIMRSIFPLVRPLSTKTGVQKPEPVICRSGELAKLSCWPFPNGSENPNARLEQ